MKFWVENAPVYGVNSNEEVIKFIDSYITCSIPDEKLNPDLYDLVMRYQRHKCTKSCQFTVKLKKNKFITKCRYGFPRSVCSETTLNTLEETIKSRGRGNIFSNENF